MSLESVAHDVWRVNGCGRFVFSLVIGIGALSRDAVASRRNRLRQGYGGQARASRGSCGEQSLRWSLETGRRRNPRCERPDRSAGPQRRQRWPFRLHHVRPGRLHGRHDCVDHKRPTFAGHATDAGEARAAMSTVQLVLGIVRGERGPQHRDASDIRRGQPGDLRDGSGAWIHDLRQPADAAATDLRQRRSAGADVGTRARPAEPDADAPEVDRLLETDLARAPHAKGELSSSNPGRTGFLVYTASGHVMVHMMQPYRRRNVGATPTPEETMATYRSYTSYFGPYTVNESEQLRRPPPRRRVQFGRGRDRLSAVPRVFREEADPEAAGHEGQQRAERADVDHLGTAE